MTENLCRKIYVCHFKSTQVRCHASWHIYTPLCPCRTFTDQPARLVVCFGEPNLRSANFFKWKITFAALWCGNYMKTHAAATVAAAMVVLPVKCWHTRLQVCNALSEACLFGHMVTADCHNEMSMFTRGFWHSALPISGVETTKKEILKKEIWWKSASNDTQSWLQLCWQTYRTKRIVCCAAKFFAK